MGVLSLTLLSGRHLLRHARLSPVTVRRGWSELAPVRPRCFPLSHRALLKIHGPDTSAFLQGIITNDMRLLEEPEQATLYSHLLNVQGRTLFDVLLYRLQEADSLCGVLLECDGGLTNSLLKHLKIYKIRRKVTVEPCPELSVWAVLPGEASKPELLTPEKATALEADPRTESMGWRLVMDKSEDPNHVIPSFHKGEVEEYHKHRYSIGLPEGAKDIPPGVALPLESNLVFMNGISFTKGCYIGQELTARTHHTGVVRKRLMPTRLSAPFSTQNLEEGAPLQTREGKPAGKHRSGLGDLGLGLVRTTQAKEELTVKSVDGQTVTLKASVPDWWPLEAKLNLERV
ncbi:unnamed protein product [Knipowitschia caucasica]|uniref:Iron-sulfur cluster assembly factor IBA57, mitochondrial n=1 Tax=Knipowitschia caucasica TaxID=637954 RepID=A0AAV2JP16_KNICA